VKTYIIFFSIGKSGLGKHPKALIVVCSGGLWLRR